MMKTFRYLIILFCSVALFSGFTHKAQEGIAVKKGQLIVRGKTMGTQWLLDDFVSQLGVASRKRDGFNKTHTYDSKGIVLFETVRDSIPTGLISEAQFYFSSAESNHVTPAGFYTGTFKVDKLLLNAALNPAKVKQKLKKWKTSDSYLEHSYRYAKDGIYIYFQFNAKEDRLVKVSLGREQK